MKHVSNELTRDIMDMQINLGPLPVHEASDFVSHLSKMMAIRPATAGVLR